MRTASDGNDAAGIAAALRRVAIGFRLAAAVWLAVLATVAVTEGRVAAAPAFATVGVATGWAVLTFALSGRQHVLKSWGWLAADAFVSAMTILGPSVAAGGREDPFFGGYPFSTVVLAAWVRGLPGAMSTAVVLAVATVARLEWGEASAATAAIVDTAVFYLAGPAILAWGIRVLLRNDADRRAAEAALADERAERVRSQERAETAAHLHDSVLQTLALIQRRSQDAAEITALARRQERELRSWLAEGRAGRARQPDTGFALELGAVVEDVERLHRITVELVTVGDAPADAGLCALAAAAREALANAAEHAGVERVSVYAEVTGSGAAVYVRDRGRGFDRAAVAADRRGIRESIEGRMARHGGSASVRSSPGAGTEVELRLERPGPRPDGTADAGGLAPQVRGQDRWSHEASGYEVPGHDGSGDPASPQRRQT